MARVRKEDKMRPEDLQAGVRRLPDLIIGAIVYYPTEAAAQRAWEGMVLKKFNYDISRVSSIIKINIDEGADGFYLRGVLHPACGHWRRPLQDLGVQVLEPRPGENWEVQPPRTMEELMMMPKGHGGRYLP